MNITEEINAIAVALGKAENMRVSAARRYVALWEYVRTPGNDGAQQVIDAGHEPTQAGLWEMIINHRSYPQELGTSWTTARRLLSTGRAEDAAAAEELERALRRRAERSRRDEARRRAEREERRKEVFPDLDPAASFTQRPDLDPTASFTQRPHVEEKCNKHANPSQEARHQAWTSGYQHELVAWLELYRAWPIAWQKHAREFFLTIATQDEAA